MTMTPMEAIQLMAAVGAIGTIIIAIVDTMVS
jgi:hypothetical protein